MANRQHYDVRSRNRAEFRVVGRFFPQGAGAVVNASNKGRGFTVARSGVGRYVVTLSETYPDLLHTIVTVGHATLVFHARVVAITTGPTGTSAMTIQVYDAANPGLAAELVVAATTWVSFDAVMSNTSRPNV